MMFKHIKYDIYGCEVSFKVELSLYLKLSFNGKCNNITPEFKNTFWKTIKLFMSRNTSIPNDITFEENK